MFNSSNKFISWNKFAWNAVIWINAYCVLFFAGEFMIWRIAWQIEIPTSKFISSWNCFIWTWTYKVNKVEWRVKVNGNLTLINSFINLIFACIVNISKWILESCVILNSVSICFIMSIEIVSIIIKKFPNKWLCVNLMRSYFSCISCSRIIPTYLCVARNFKSIWS